ncbi:hypothetical protein AC623_10970 [Bacillus sp. FJAT-27231]|uniref:hypothetical protein n=1 Tax=Bacillus sp. FJAT-27231 TaxID=1679168 RepID=UPI0006708519|nr:hypothetical protein [Bacillus sp. FJAT-27231]KMY54387.1 hypothetical protein AC623_10970 [Bacillus sp. FJAT-27231]
MRKIYGIENLIAYLSSVNFPLIEERIKDVILKRELPHYRAFQTTFIFNLDRIDWWISQKRLKP